MIFADYKLVSIYFFLPIRYIKCTVINHFEGKINSKTFSMDVLMKS